MAAEAAGRDDATVRPAECNEMEERVRGKTLLKTVCKHEKKEENLRVEPHQAFPAEWSSLPQHRGEESQDAHHCSGNLDYLHLVGLAQAPVETFKC